MEVGGNVTVFFRLSNVQSHTFNLLKKTQSNHFVKKNLLPDGQLQNSFVHQNISHRTIQRRSRWLSQVERRTPGREVQGSISSTPCSVLEQDSLSSPKYW